ncbi:hypothetical protein [Phnomibacter sp. MR]|uniref:hypothetical protein n=1 Tax=Phnomibacter sp. MR TaxID=3042318 RepID=UPI003A811A93
MNWVLLHKTAIYTEAAIIKGKLEENDIPAQILNKQDSMYVLTLPGMHEIYVPGQLKELALGVLQEVLSN